MEPLGRISVSDAIDLLVAELAPLPAQDLGLEQASGRVLAEEVRAAGDHPNADLAAFDGLACRVADSLDATAQTPVRLRLRGEVGAGDPPHPGLAPGEACLIYTGGVLPPGADGVVPLEAMRREGGTLLLMQPATAAMVRGRASSWRAGERLLRAGERLEATRLALAASAGRLRLEVRPAPRVVVVASGAELHPPGAAGLPAGHHIESNGLAVAMAARQLGADVLRLERLGDDPEALRRSLDAAAAEADLIIGCGGSAHSGRDHLRQLMAEEGGLRWRRLAVRPAAPSLYGRWRGTPLLGLPGRPLGAMVAFLLLAQPALTALQGGLAPVPYRRRQRAVARWGMQAAPEAESLLPVALRWRLGELEAHEPRQAAEGGEEPATTTGRVGDSEMWPAAADGLALLAPGERRRPGEVLEVIPFRPGQPV